MSLKDHLQKIQSQIPDHVQLIAVTKTHPVERINEAIASGITHIGENRIQEAQSKFPHLIDQVEKHLIGHLQRNKVKTAIQLFDCIQSVDSLRLAQKIEDECTKINKVMPIFLEVNIASDPNKYGFHPSPTTSEAVEKALTTITTQHPHLQVIGLMTIVPYAENPENTRPHFRKMRQLFEKLQQIHPQLKHLSMGMSNDYQIAIEEGATMVRLGSALFGKR